LVAFFIMQSLPLSRDREVLTGEPKHHEVHLPAQCRAVDLRHIAEVRYLRPAMREHGAGERVNLREGDWCPPQRLERQGGRFYSRK
jgi:hypothetical protein